MRCIALSQAWQDRGGDVTFLSHCDSNALRQRITDEGFEFVPVEKPHPDPSDLSKTLHVLKRYASYAKPHAPSWLALDGYHFTTDYQKAIRENGYKLLFIDDIAHLHHYYADILLNQNISASSLNYSCDMDTVKLLGCEYVLLGREFIKYKDWKRKIPDNAKNILVTMGGSDPDNVTLKVIKALNNLNDPDLEVKIVAGPANPNISSLEKGLYLSSFNFHLLSSVNNMPEIMAWADVAVSAGGSTCWELAYMGLPSLVLSLAENQKPIVESLDNNDAVLNLGSLSSLTSNDIARLINTITHDEPRRKELSIRFRDIVDGAGKYRVINQMMLGSIKLKSATIEDCGLLWDWVNDPVVRSHSFSSNHISWEEHKKWFEKVIKKPNCNILIAFDYADEPIGQIRFEGKGNDAVVSLSIKKSKRGLGYGRLLIKSGCQKFFIFFFINVIHAYIKTDNISSIHSFIKSGFIQNKHDSKYQLPSPNALHYMLKRKGVR